VMQVLQELNREGMTIVLITHEPDIARCARRMIVLRDGQVVEDRPMDGCRDLMQGVRR